MNGRYCQRRPAVHWFLAAADLRCREASPPSQFPGTGAEFHNRVDLKFYPSVHYQPKGRQITVALFEYLPST